MQINAADLDEIASACAGDPGALRAVARRSLPQVVEWCARLGGPAVDAEDAAHDVMIVVFTRLGTLREAQHYWAWLFGVTRRVLAQHRRRAWVRRRLPWLGNDIVSAAPGPHEDAERSDLTFRIRTVLEDLSERHREVLVLSDVEERSESEIADLLRIPVGTVRSRVYRARKAFVAAAARHHLPLISVGIAEDMP